MKDAKTETGQEPAERQCSRCSETVPAAEPRNRERPVPLGKTVTCEQCLKVVQSSSGDFCVRPHVNGADERRWLCHACQERTRVEADSGVSSWPEDDAPTPLTPIFSYTDVCDILCQGCALRLESRYGPDVMRTRVGVWHVLNGERIECRAAAWRTNERALELRSLEREGNPVADRTRYEMARAELEGQQDRVLAREAAREAPPYWTDEQLAEIARGDAEIVEIDLSKVDVTAAEKAPLPPPESAAAAEWMPAAEVPPGEEA